MVHNYDSIRAVKKLKQRIETNEKITIMWNSKVIDVFGVDHVEQVHTENVITGQSTWLDAQGIFIYVGRVPTRYYSF